jgi:hypothetical protein
MKLFLNRNHLLDFHRPRDLQLDRPLKAESIAYVSRLVISVGDYTLTFLACTTTLSGPCIYLTHCNLVLVHFVPPEVVCVLSRHINDLNHEVDIRARGAQPFSWRSSLAAEEICMFFLAGQYSRYKILAFL